MANTSSPWWYQIGRPHPENLRSLSPSTIHMSDNKTTTPSGESCPVQNNKTTQDASVDKPKPCCVCLDEKRERDECLMFKGFEDKECLKMIDNYKQCMKSYGFDIWSTWLTIFCWFPSANKWFKPSRCRSMGFFFFFFSLFFVLLGTMRKPNIEGCIYY